MAVMKVMKRMLVVGGLCLMLLPLFLLAAGVARAALSLSGDFVQLPVDHTSNDVVSEKKYNNNKWVLFGGGFSDGLPRTISIENLPPVANNVTITPSVPDPSGLPFGIVPTAGTEIRVEYGYFDADGDPEGQTLIRWSRGDQIEQQEQPALNEQHTVPGGLTTIPEELWCVIITPHDGVSYGEPRQACAYIEQIPNQLPIPPIGEEVKITQNPSDDDPLELISGVGDPDPDGPGDLGGDNGSGKVIVEVRWYRNGVLQQVFNNQPQVPESETNVGEKWCARLRAFNGEGFGPEKEVGCVIISPLDNTLPTVENLTITPSEPKDSDALEISYLFVDPDGESGSGEGATQIQWFRNGQIQPHLNDQRVVPAELTAPGERWWASVRPHDGQGYGCLAVSPPVYIGQEGQNTPPEVTDVRITPAEPGDQDHLQLRYTFIDADGDPQGNTIVRWFRDLAHMRDYDDLTVIPHAATQPGDRWHAVVIPHDGTEYGSDVAAHSVMIGGGANTAPEAKEVLLLPSQPGDDGRLELDYVYCDEDGDLEGDTQVRWTKNFLPQATYNDQTVIPAGVTQVGDSWCATLMPHDGFEFGLPVASNCVVVQEVAQNTPPEVTNAYILPAPATSSDDLELRYQYFDADNDPEGYTNIRWYRNGTLQKQFNDQSVVRASHTSAGEVWYATIQPHDGSQYGGKSVTQAVIINSPPQVVASIVPTAPLESDNLMLSYQFSDPDRDPESEARIHWYKNGVHQKQYDGLKELPPEATSPGDSWYVEIAVSDGFQFSEPFTTNPVTIAPIWSLYLPMIIRPGPHPDTPTPSPTPTPTATPTPADPFEENDTQESAYGPLSNGELYDALPNDQDDWYYFNLYETSSHVRLQVSNYHGKGQLMLYREELDTEGNFTRRFVANDGRGERIMEIPNYIDPNALRNLRPGKYLVRIYTVDDYREDASYLYRLRVEYDLR